MDDGQDGPLAGKPYAFVTILPVKRRTVPGHQALLPDRFHGVVRLELAALQPIHVGGGTAPVVRAGGLIKPFFRAGGTICIPGSSVKGVIRAIVEAVSHSCPPVLPEGRFSHELPHPGEKACPNGESLSLCPACGLFGYVNGGQLYRGRVSFTDFRPMGAVRTDRQQLIQFQRPHPELGALYLNGEGKLHGRKFYYHGCGIDKLAAQGQLVYEVLPARARLAGELRFLNLDQAELALLAFGLGLDGSFSPKIGQGKPAYLGSFQLRVADGVVRQGFQPVADPRALLADLAAGYSRSGPPVASAIAELRYILNADAPEGPEWREVKGKGVY